MFLCQTNSHDHWPPNHQPCFVDVKFAVISRYLRFRIFLYTTQGSDEEDATAVGKDLINERRLIAPYRLSRLYPNPKINPSRLLQGAIFHHFPPLKRVVGFLSPLGESCTLHSLRWGGGCLQKKEKNIIQRVVLVLVCGVLRSVLRCLIFRFMIYVGFQTSCCRH